MEDMEAAYKVLNGKKIADGVRCIIIPATMQIMRECVERGYVTAFIDAGAVVSTPTCGPCLGGYMGILARASVVFQPQTVTLSAEWDTLRVRSTLQVLILRRQVL